MALIPYTAADGIYVKLSPWSQTYLEWADQQGLTPENLEKFQDPDNDQMSNALEMFVGGNPLKAEAHLHPVPGLVEIEGLRYLTLSFYQAYHALNSDLGEEFEKSVDLQIWKKAELISHSSLQGPAACRYYQTLRMTTPITGNPRTFLRISFQELPSDG